MNDRLRKTAKKIIDGLRDGSLVPDPPMDDEVGDCDSMTIANLAAENKKLREACRLALDRLGAPIEYAQEVLHTLREALKGD